MLERLTPSSEVILLTLTAKRLDVPTGRINIRWAETLTVFNRFNIDKSTAPNSVLLSSLIARCSIELHCTDRLQKSNEPESDKLCKLVESARTSRKSGGKSKHASPWILRNDRYFRLDANLSIAPGTFGQVCGQLAWHTYCMLAELMVSPCRLKISLKSYSLGHTEISIPDTSGTFLCLMRSAYLMLSYDKSRRIPFLKRKSRSTKGSWLGDVVGEFGASSATYPVCWNNSCPGTPQQAMDKLILVVFKSCAHGNHRNTRKDPTQSADIYTKFEDSFFPIQSSGHVVHAYHEVACWRPFGNWFHLSGQKDVADLQIT